MELCQVAENNDIQVITFPELLDDNHLKQIESATKIWLLSACPLHIFDFAKVKKLSTPLYRPFISYKHSLKIAGKHLFCVNISPKLIPQFRQDGLLGVFIPVESISEAKLRVSSMTEKKKVDVDLINAFLVAAQTVISSQSNTKLNPKKPRLRSKQEIMNSDIAGMLRLDCDHFKGSITLAFPSAVFLKVYENMVGEVHDKITEEVQDAAGELLNIIFGQAKTFLNDQKGYNLQKSLPSVLVGEELRLKQANTQPSLILPFETESGEFFIEIAIDAA